MSMINNTSIESNTINGCSLWQLGTEFQLHQAVGGRDDYQRWRSAASRGFAYADADDDDAQCRRYHFSDMSLKLSEMKIQHPDKWYKTLPPAEMLPRNEVLGGFIFVCNNETMQEDLHRQLFGLPQKYKDSVRAITPGLPLFLYNYTAHQLHGVFQAVSFGGSNIDPTAWEDKKCKGESRFPAQVRIRIKKKCKPLEEDAFRPILHHYDGPKFRLQLSVPEALALLDLFKEEEL
ncbi:B2 protein-like [Corylus avellana]|uniref:B2 protein-like n=1 Tax=Corylus avellana TaxID=13451 RepID=UPI00286B17A1|nr:B2 protein-like [Corylus avellana]